MLIKYKNLAKIHTHSNVLYAEYPEATRAAQIEINKAIEEASAIKKEARVVLEESNKKLAEAEAKVKEIIEAANRQAETIKQKVYSETLSVAKAEADKMRKQASLLLVELFNIKRQALFQAHSDIVKVALDLSEKIIRYQVSIDPNVLRTQVIEAIKKATSEADRVQVYVNPQDLTKLEESIDELEKLFPSGIDIVPLSNDSVDPGSCVVETRSGQLDARFSTQLKSLTDLALKAEVPEPQIDTEEDVQFTQDIKEISQPKNEAESPLLPIEEEQEVTQEEFPIASEMLEIPEEIINKVKDDKEPKLKKKKLFSEDLTKRTKEEELELDEAVEYKEEIQTKSILRPKKQSQTPQISDIVSDLEENPEWKDLLQDEDEE